jgi:uncharacterized protein YbcC (UPF0753/DUF2309 family)
LDKDQKNSAKIVCNKSLDFIRYKDTYFNIFDTDKIYLNCKDIESSSPTINAKFAKDIDKLENLIQLYIYRSLYPEKINQEIFDEFKDNLKQKLTTEYVKIIAESFISWSESQSNFIPNPKALFNNDSDYSNELLLGLDEKIIYPPNFKKS